MICISYYDSPVGRLLIKAEDASVSGIWFVGQKYFPQMLVDTAPINEKCEIIQAVHRWLDDYFSGGKPDSSHIKLAPEGSSFRKTVWEILCHIPYGSTMSYGQIAKELELRTGRRMSAQAVGGAVGHNPISIIIPCHRVLGANGSLTGYAGGLEKKTALLTLEGIKI